MGKMQHSPIVDRYIKKVFNLSRSRVIGQSENQKGGGASMNVVVIIVFLLRQIWIVKYSVKYSIVDCKFLLFLQDFSLD